MNVNGSHLHRMHCIGIIHMQWVIFSIFIQFSLPQQTLMPSPILSTQNDKETRENQKQTNLGQWELFCKIWHMYIALLQFYKQMYNKYIINRLLLWDSEEPACVFFFSSFSCVPVRKGHEPWLPFTRSTRTPLHYDGRNPSTPRSPCLLSDGWHSVRCLCCLPWSFCAQNLGGDVWRW